MFGSNDSQQDGQTNSGVMGQDQGSSTLGMPMSSDSSMPSPAANPMLGAPAMGSNDAPSADETAASDTSTSSRDMHAQTPEDLMAIKQDALQSLKPLIGHLDQTPEEKFRTTMMMIQASDDQSLIPAAHEAAKAIEDEKTRAQALLDVVNEINYFTQAAKQQ